MRGSKAASPERIESMSPDATRPSTFFFSARPRTTPLEISFLERHPLGSQAFIPLGRTPFLVLVAQHPEPESLRLFRTDGRQGVNYRRGVWQPALDTFV